MRIKLLWRWMSIKRNNKRLIDIRRKEERIRLKIKHRKSVLAKLIKENIKVESTSSWKMGKKFYQLKHINQKNWNPLNFFFDVGLLINVYNLTRVYINFIGIWFFEMACSSGKTIAQWACSVESFSSEYNSEG